MPAINTPQPTARPAARHTQAAQPASHYTSIAIIYNPISTGPSRTYALRLRRELRQALPHMKESINTVLTEYAGHAEVLAYQLAKAGGLLNVGFRVKDAVITPYLGL